MGSFRSSIACSSVLFKKFCEFSFGLLGEEISFLCLGQNKARSREGWRQEVRVNHSDQAYAPDLHFQPDVFSSSWSRVLRPAVSVFCFHDVVYLVIYSQYTAL